MATEWEEFKRLIDDFDPEAGPMPDEQYKRFRELIWTAKPPKHQRDTRTLEEVIDDLNDYRKQQIWRTEKQGE